MYNTNKILQLRKQTRALPFNYGLSDIKLA